MKGYCKKHMSWSADQSFPEQVRIEPCYKKDSVSYACAIHVLSRNSQDYGLTGE